MAADIARSPPDGKLVVDSCRIRLEKPPAGKLQVEGADEVDADAAAESNNSNELGNKCGKCQNHEIGVSKKGHARDCPFKKCDCLKCRLLDARSDILQVISGKETKLKGTKKDPNCGFCQNHDVKILRKGHVRSCGFGQERHFKLDNCFDCEVHYIRNEVNRLQIKMRRAMKEDRMLSEEQRKTAREPITRDEVEKVCGMARLARKKRESILAQQAVAGGGGHSSAGQHLSQQQSQQMKQQSSQHSSSKSSPQSSSASLIFHHHSHHQPKVEHIPTSGHLNHLDLSRQAEVWRPWSQHQVAAAMQVAAQHHQPVAHTQLSMQQHHQMQLQQPQLQQQQQLVSHNLNLNLNQYQQQQHSSQSSRRQAQHMTNANPQTQNQPSQKNLSPGFAPTSGNQRVLVNMLPAHTRVPLDQYQQQHHLLATNHGNSDMTAVGDLQHNSPPSNLILLPSTPMSSPVAQHDSSNNSNNNNSALSTEQIQQQQQLVLSLDQQTRDIQQRHLALAFLRALFMAQAAQQPPERLN